jgi:hypothetical protein
MGIVLGMLPLSAIVLLAMAWVRDEGWRAWARGFVEAGVLASCWLLLGTELLSLVSALSFWAVLAWWTGRWWRWLSS